MSHDGTWNWLHDEIDAVEAEGGLIDITVSVCTGADWQGVLTWYPVWTPESERGRDDRATRTVQILGGGEAASAEEVVHNALTAYVAYRTAENPQWRGPKA